MINSVVNFQNEQYSKPVKQSYTAPVYPPEFCSRTTLSASRTTLRSPSKLSLLRWRWVPRYSATGCQYLGRTALAGVFSPYNALFRCARAWRSFAGRSRWAAFRPLPAPRLPSSSDDERADGETPLAPSVAIP